jgi:hypothetical protein
VGIASQLGGRASRIGGKGLPRVPRRENHGEIGSLGHGFPMLCLPCEDEAGRYDDSDVVDAQSKDLLSLP